MVGLISLNPALVLHTLHVCVSKALVDRSMRVDYIGGGRVEEGSRGCHEALQSRIAIDICDVGIVAALGVGIRDVFCDLVPV